MLIKNVIDDKSDSGDDKVDNHTDHTDLKRPLADGTDADAGPSKKSATEEMTHFNITDIDGRLRGQTVISSLDEVQKDMWVLVSYDAQVYVGQVMSVHPNHPVVGDGARVKCLKSPYTVDPSIPQDFEAVINWIVHSIRNIYVCPVRVRKTVVNRKTLWFYQ